MDFLAFLEKNIVYLDGGMGTLLQEKGLAPGEAPERWNLTHPDLIRGIHKAYFEAGSQVVCTNTFGANLLKFGERELEEILSAAVDNAKWAREEAEIPGEKFIALDIGPTGKLIKPLGDLDFEDAVKIFAETVKIGARLGVDLIFIETMNDSLETKAALLAAKENTDLPVMVSNAYGEDGKLMTGATPEAMVAMLEGMGVAALGANCSLGPRQLQGVARELVKFSSVPVILKPNAGLPREVDGKTVFDICPMDFAETLTSLIGEGVRVAGGCCGTTPAYIKALKEKSDGLAPVPVEEKERTVISSYTHAVLFGSDPVLIGERINPTGKKRFQQALREKDMDFILAEGVKQEEAGVHALDVNVGLPEIDEVQLLTDAVTSLQSVLDLPLQIDSSHPRAMEAALRRYNGKAMINSVNGKEESMKKIFPLVKKYGGVTVALTLDEDGIPEDADGRVRIAEKILNTAKAYGIKKKDIIFDPLALTVSADPKAAAVTLEALRRIRDELGCHTSLGVSNVSFGLPERGVINGTFFALALENGLSAAIMNPFSEEMRKTYFSYRALKGLDENLTGYIRAAETFAPTSTAAGQRPGPEEEERDTDLQSAVMRGRQDAAAQCTRKMLAHKEALAIVNEEIIPALSRVGEGFEQKKIYLPQLLMSAESAKSAFEVIRESLAGEKSVATKGVFVIATVQGDIHDIGKNIVKLLLENYGFFVVDLGKDVPPERVVEEVVERHAPLVGLSALMTTTVPSMKETIRQLKERAPWCKCVVGGAVLTEEYARRIGADKFAKDALECVRYAEDVIRCL